MVKYSEKDITRTCCTNLSFLLLNFASSSQDSLVSGRDNCLSVAIAMDCLKLVIVMHNFLDFYIMLFFFYSFIRELLWRQ